MKASLVGVHSVWKRLANGDRRRYHYAWRGGPRIKAEPDTNQFLAEYTRLCCEREDAPFQGCMAELIRGYMKSNKYTKKKDSTKEGYDLAIKAIEAEFFDMTTEKLVAHGTRGIFLEWRDEIAKKHPRKADLYMSVLQAILSNAVNHELIARHPLLKVDKVSDGTRRDMIWSEEEIARFKASAPEPLVRALMLGLWTGQRQGDLLALTWAGYDGKSIGLTQGKTGAFVRFKVADELKQILDDVARKNAQQKVPATTILTTNQGLPWASGFKSSWRKAVQKAKIEGLTYHDLRGTFVTLAHRNGTAIKDIAQVTGHTEKDAEAIIKKHYLVASTAVTNIESGKKL